MKKYCAYGLVFLFLLTTFHAYAQDVNGILKKVKEKLGQVKDYQADAMMKLNVPFLQVPDSKVIVYYKQPDKFRIRQQKGISLVPRGGISINLNTLLSENKYTAVDAGKSTINNQPVNVIKLLPLNDEEEVVLSTLYVDTKSSLVKKIVTTTKENGSYTIEFIYGKYSSWALPDELVFSFNTKDYKLPKGMTFDYEEDTTRIEGGKGEKDKGEKGGKDDKGAKAGKGEVKISFINYTINKGVPDNVFEYR